MLILAGDTTTRSASVALVRDGAVLGETTLSLGRTHSTTFMPVLEGLMHRCSVTHADLDAYACTVGPGSYTGIRIGLAAFQMMAFASGKPVYGVSTLEALAFPLLVSPTLVVCPMVDARGGRIFACALQSAGRAEDRAFVLVPEGNVPVVDFCDVLSDAMAADGSRVAVLCGDGAPLHHDRVQARLQGLSVGVVRGSLLSPLASSVALLAQRRLEAGLPGDPARLAASYLSPSQAEREASGKARTP